MREDRGVRLGGIISLCGLLLVAGSVAVCADAGLEIEKLVTTTSGSCLSAGNTLSVYSRSTVRFCYTIRNTGTSALSSVRLVEDNGTPTDPSDDFEVPLGFSVLHPHTILSVQYDHYVEETGVISFSASFTGNNDGPSGGSLAVEDDVVVTVAPIYAQLEIEKKVTHVGGSCLSAGDTTSADARTTIRFCYEIRNSGRATASNLELVEDNGTPNDPSDDYTVSLGGYTEIYPNVLMQIEHDYYLETPGTFTHTASISGTNEGTGGGIVQASDSVLVTVAPVNAEITLAKHVTTSGGSCLSAGTSLAAEAGSEIKFCYTIKNIGKAALLNFTLTEDNGTPNDPSDDYQYPLGTYGDVLLPNFTLFINDARTTPVPPNLGAVDYTVTLHGTNDGTSGGTIDETDAVTVTWSDTVSPTISSCLDDVRVGNTWGILGARVDFGQLIATDSSGMTPDISFIPSSGSIFPIGTTQVQAIATDAGGNSDACKFAVTVVYETAPRIQISEPSPWERFTLDELVQPQFHIDAVAPLDHVETTELLDGALDTSVPGCHEFVITATDDRRLSTTASIFYCVSYLVGPLGPMDGWPEDWLFVANALPLSQRELVGVASVGGRYVAGEAIEVFFTLRDLRGVPKTHGIGQLSVVRVEDVNDAIPGEVIAFYAVPYDADLLGYQLDVSTTEWPPGYYDLWLGLDDETTRRVRIEIQGN